MQDMRQRLTLCLALNVKYFGNSLLYSAINVSLRIPFSISMSSCSNRQTHSFAQSFSALSVSRIMQFTSKKTIRRILISDNLQGANHIRQESIYRGIRNFDMWNHEVLYTCKHAAITLRTMKIILDENVSNNVNLTNVKID